MPRDALTVEAAWDDLSRWLLVAFELEPGPISRVSVIDSHAVRLETHHGHAFLLEVRPDPLGVAAMT